MRAPRDGLLIFALALFALEGRSDGTLPVGADRVEVESVEGARMPALHIRAAMSARWTAVTALFDDCGKHKHLLPRAKETVELSREGDRVRCRYTLEAPWPLGEQVVITRATHRSDGERFTRRWQLESGPFKRYEGTWTVTKHGEDASLVDMRMHIEPDVPLPTFLLERGVKSGGPAMLARLRALLGEQESSRAPAPSSGAMAPSPR